MDEKRDSRIIVLDGFSFAKKDFHSAGLLWTTPQNKPPVFIVQIWLNGPDKLQARVAIGDSVEETVGQYLEMLSQLEDKNIMYYEEERERLVKKYSLDAKA